ncbi:MAG: MASE3 domain-containing protein, partial [Desulfosudaceae bacterium]
MNLPRDQRSMLNFAGMVLFAVILAVVTTTSLYSYLLFHVFCELFSIIVAGAIFVIAWNGRHMITNTYLLIVGISFFFVGLLDLLHTLSYPGMDIFPEHSGNLSIQLWLAARYLQSLTFLGAAFFFHKEVPPLRVVILYTVVTAAVLGAVFQGDFFPVSFGPGAGLTPFKIVSEYLIALILLVALGQIIRYRRLFDDGVAGLLMGAVGLTIASELTFTFYVDVYGVINLIGHLLKLTAFYLLYKAIVETAFLRPYSLLFNEIRQREQELQESRDLLQKSHGYLEEQAYQQAIELAQATAELQTTRIEKEQIRGLYQRVGDLIPFGTWICDVQGKFVYLSQSLLDILEESGRELKFEDLLDRLDPGIVAAVRRDWEESLATGAVWDRKLRLQDRTGAIYTILSRGLPFYNEAGVVQFWGGINLDISERERLREALEKERRRFYFILEKMPAFVVLVREDAAIPYANQYFKKQFGDPAGEKCYHLLAGRNNPCEDCRVFPVLESGQPLEWDWLDAPDNRIYHVYSYPFTDIDETPLVLVVGMNITDRVEAENHVNHYLQELETKNQELQDFAYVASHDLQEPLRKIITFGNMLRTRYGSSLDEKAGDYLLRMENAARRMRSLVAALLEYSRVTTKESLMASVNLNQVIAKVMEDLEEPIKRSGARIEVAPLEIVTADPHQMRQLFQNLISNAVKFTAAAEPLVSINGRIVNHHKGPVDGLSAK